VRNGIPGVFEVHGVHFSPCLIQKCGSFNFFVLLDALGARKVDDRQESLLQEESVPRFTVVRDPYSRLISAFLDKLAGQNGFERGGDGFLKFIDYLWSNWNICGRNFSCIRSSEANKQMREAVRHVRTQVSYCNQPAGFQLDLVFRLEESSMWLPELLVRLNISEDEQRAPLNKAHLGVSRAGCPFSENPQSYACRGFFHDRACHSQGRPTGRSFLHKPRNSRSKLVEFYSEVSAIHKVSVMYYEDFIEYGFPFWGEE
jgi:hypothetical protein